MCAYMCLVGLGGCGCECASVCAYVRLSVCLFTQPTPRRGWGKGKRAASESGGGGGGRREGGSVGVGK